MKAFLFCKTILVCFFSCYMTNCYLLSNQSPIPRLNREINVAPTLLPIDNAKKVIDKNYVLLISEGSAPVKILDATAADKNYDFKRGIEVKVKNVSDKDITNIEVGVASPPECLNFYRVGDRIINSKNEKQENASIMPLNGLTIYIPSEVAASYLAPQNYLSKCPKESNKPIIYIWGVEFKDNTSWKSKIWENNENQ